MNNPYQNNHRPEIINNPYTRAADAYILEHFEKHFPNAELVIINYEETTAVIVETTLSNPILYSFLMGSDNDTYYFHKYSNEPEGPSLLEFPIFPDPDNIAETWETWDE